ncbi:MAG: hypothetical protein JST81_13815 [Bacteroidetes bacterium]|jgi:hypothetical protein|nr:hypothetical protein [Bacteroidota bacterium]
MKKLVLLTGIFLSLSVMVSAQQKKTALPAPTTQTAPQKKETIKDMRAEKNAARIKKAEARQKAKKQGSAATKETQDMKVN